jgi:hypothetical protein
LAVPDLDGTSVSTAVRAALIEAAKTAAPDRLRAEAAQLLWDMETLRAS